VLPKLAEWHVYGNEQQGRFLTKYPEIEPTHYGVEIAEDVKNSIFSRQLGKKAYELKDHLGNVRVTHSDVKMPTGSGLQPFRVDLLSKSEYYPYGMQIEDLSYQTANSRYSFNSQEKDNELNKNMLSAEFWEYDARSARRWNLDPKPTASISNYSTFQSNPIIYSDMRGDSVSLIISGPTLKKVDDYSYSNGLAGHVALNIDGVIHSYEGNGQWSISKYKDYMNFEKKDRAVAELTLNVDQDKVTDNLVKKEKENIVKPCDYNVNSNSCVTNVLDILKSSDLPIQPTNGIVTPEQVFEDFKTSIFVSNEKIFNNYIPSLSGRLTYQFFKLTEYFFGFNPTGQNINTKPLFKENE
jgi:hypothetical protein